MRLWLVFVAPGFARMLSCLGKTSFDRMLAGRLLRREGLVFLIWLAARVALAALAMFTLVFSLVTYR